MAGPSAELSPVIAASTHWLARAYPAGAADSIAHTLAELQARQAVTVAAWLRYPTAMDAALVAIAGPGGSAVLDWRVGSEPDDEEADGRGLAHLGRRGRGQLGRLPARRPGAGPARAVDAVAAAVPVADDRPRPHPRRAGGLPSEFRRLTDAGRARPGRRRCCCATPTCSSRSPRCTATTLRYLLGVPAVAAPVGGRPPDRSPTRAEPRSPP